MSSEDEISTINNINEIITIKCRNESDLSIFKSLTITAMNYVYKTFNLLLIPMPSITGRDITVIFMNESNKTDIEIFQQYYLLYRFKFEEKK